MEWLAGMRMTAERLNDNTADETTTSGLVIASGWSSGTLTGRKVNGVTTVLVTVVKTTPTITASSTGAFPAATLACTLPVGWRPQDTLIENYDKSGVADGAVTILSNGTCTVKTLSPTATIASGNTITFFASWISENG